MFPRYTEYNKQDIKRQRERILKENSTRYLRLKYGVKTQIKMKEKDRRMQSWVEGCILS